MAIDFAITSGLQQGALDRSAEDSSAVVVEYEERKRSHLGTADLCSSAGFGFEPFVVEAHGGGLGPAARRMLTFVASAAAALESAEVEEKVVRVAGSLASALWRETARAIVRRLSPLRDTELSATAYPEAWGEQHRWQ